jgi:guanine deaminase
LTPEDFMRRTIELASENARSGRGGPFSAVVVRDGQIVAEGTNLVTSTNDPTAHAEVVAIRRACEALGEVHLSGCELYASCEPCPMCLGAIYWSQPKMVYYCATHKDAAAAGFDDSFIYEQIRLPVGDRSIPMTRLLTEASNQPFDEWRANENRIPY